MIDLKNNASTEIVLDEEGCKTTKSYSYDKEYIYLNVYFGNFSWERIFRNTVQGNEDLDSFVANKCTAESIKNWWNTIQ